MEVNLYLLEYYEALGKGFLDTKKAWVYKTLRADISLNYYCFRCLMLPQRFHGRVISVYFAG
jgi:hypothetical protein